MKQVRKRLRYGQREFASALGLTRDQVANIEAGRTPLTYRVAWSMREIFGVNLTLLAGLPADPAEDHARWMPPDAPEFAGRSSLFSEVAREAFLNPPDNLRRIAGRFPKGTFERNHFIAQVDQEAFNLLAKVPTTHVSSAGFAAILAVREIGSKFPQMPPAEVAEIAMDLDAFSSSGRAQYVSQNNKLTSEALSLTVTPMQPVLPKLIERLKRATEAYGRKAELAAWLGVHRQCVTDWLSGKQEPGGETTLRLLHWVEAEERKQQESAGSASPPPAPKTRFNESHEKPKKPSPP